MDGGTEVNQEANARETRKTNIEYKSNKRIRKEKGGWNKLKSEPGNSLIPISYSKTNPAT